MVNVAFDVPENGIYEMTVVDVLGQLVYNENVETIAGSNRSEINFSDFPVGIYFLRIRKGDTMVVERIVKSK